MWVIMYSIHGWSGWNSYWHQGCATYLTFRRLDVYSTHGCLGMINVKQHLWHWSNCNRSWCHQWRGQGYIQYVLRTACALSTRNQSHTQSKLFCLRPKDLGSYILSYTLYTKFDMVVLQKQTPVGWDLRNTTSYQTQPMNDIIPKIA